MKSIERRFNKVSKKHPDWSSYVCFIGAIADQDFTIETMRRWFYKLVDENDYSPKDKLEVLGYLVSVLKHPEDNKI